MLNCETIAIKIQKMFNKIVRCEPELLSRARESIFSRLHLAIDLLTPERLICTKNTIICAEISRL